MLSTVYDGFKKVCHCIYLSCPIWKATPALAAMIGLTAKQPLTCSIHVHFETEVLVALEHRIFHNLPDKILQLTRPEIEILVPIGRSIPQVEALDATILYSLLHSFVQIRVEFLGVKLWSTEHINGLLELNVFPPVTSNVYPTISRCIL